MICKLQGCLLASLCFEGNAVLGTTILTVQCLSYLEYGQLFCSVEALAAMQYSNDALSLSVLCTDPAVTNPGMSSTLDHRRAATTVTKSLGLQTDLTARAFVLVAADSTVGNSLQDLIQLNEDDPGLKALVEEF